jgi:hypothetical protein
VNGDARARISRHSVAKTTLGAILGGVCALAIMIALDPEWFKNLSGSNRDRNQRELLTLHEALALGITQQEVRVLVKQPAFTHLKLFGDSAHSVWWIQTPLEFGAQNWTLGLQFTDGRLTATRVRMEDGDFHPTGAPRDRGTWRVTTESERAG